MITIVLMVIAVILFFGMIAEGEKFNKRTYCYGFIACVIAVVALKVMEALV